ncbi:MAG: site-2 protease family protein [Acidobacteriota bacterium]
MKLPSKPLSLGQLFGIPLFAHYSWLPVIPFYAWAIASSLLPREAPGLPISQYWLFGFLTTFLLFASVLGHELAHALMARAEGLGTGSITLYIFGGLAALKGQPANPGAEFKIAIVGPAASFLLGTIFFLIAQILPHDLRVAEQMFRHLGLVNWVLAGFNILPGLPLDGGRVLRAMVWRFNKNFRKATQVAARAGLVIALSLIINGLAYFFFNIDQALGLACLTMGIIIALLLMTSEGQNYGVFRAKRGTIEDFMNRDVMLIDPAMKVVDFINSVLKNNRDTIFPVARDKRLHGLLMLEDLKSMPEEEWKKLEAKDCMRPVDDSMFISAKLNLQQAHTILTANKFGRAVVIDTNGMIIGYVSLSDIRKAKST